LLGTHQPDDDAKRFQAWQRAALNARPAGTELLSLGAFRAVVPLAYEGGAWVTLVEGRVDKRETDKAVEALRALFKRRNAALEIEYNEPMFPGIGPWLEATGLTLAERNPLMACRPDRFKPPAASDVALQRLTAASDAADLEAFQTIRWTNGGDNQDPVPSVEQLRKELAATTSVYLLALLDAERAGTGVSHTLEGATEVVGVVTRAEKRRRGVAAAVTADLVSRAFAEGRDFVFLDAANEGAARIYERLGFKRFGANLVYRDRTSPD
jgi:ribosomal protein S18 acetylase RimI-like enzyme